MILLMTVVHAVFVGIFFFFHRYIEMSVIVVIFFAIISKIIPPLDILKKPAFLVLKTPESTTLEQSIYVSSGVLFYTALVGISLSISKALGIPPDLHLFYYCIFFLTSAVYGIYLLVYPKNSNIFILFRTHSLLVSALFSAIVMASVLFGTFAIEMLTLVNLLLTTLGVAMILLLDRHVPLTTHITAVYIFIIALLSLVVGFVSSFALGLPMVLFILLFLLTTLYIFFPEVLTRAALQSHVPLLLWHFSNCILACSWAMFFYFSWSLFWGFMDDRAVIMMSLFLLMGLWMWVYATDEKNPLFFTGMTAVAAVFYGFFTFEIVPSLFWIITVCLFLFAGGILLLSRWFRGDVEERILAAASVIFLCGADLVLIFQENNLFNLSTLFLFESFLWYGAYEIFHRHSKLRPSHIS